MKESYKKGEATAYRKKANITVFKAPKLSFKKRLLRFIFNPWMLSIFLSIVVTLLLTATYFWLDYSAKIDLMLSGQIFTRNAGIYAAPKTLYEGEKITQEELIKYLKSAGYIEKNSKADETRSRYLINENTIFIEPGESGLIDGEKIFSPLSVKFSKDKKQIESISELKTSRKVKQAKLEPKIISSIAAERDGRRKVISFKDLPEHLVKAIVVTEDRSFFDHYGINFRGILRALWRHYEGENDSPIAYQGGSSITQQLVKNLFLTPERTIKRKLQEAYMSIILETRLTKEEIFTLYVNQIYLGQQAGMAIYGVGEAANAYFGKDVTQLSLSESAFIAGLIRSPNRYSPYKNMEKAVERRNQVLISMLETDQISEEQFYKAKHEPLRVIPPNRPEFLDMPYFTQYVEEELPKYVKDPEALQHLRIYTTIDVDLQLAAYKAVTKHLQKLEKLFPKKDKSQLQAALVALNAKTGEVVAMIGGKNFLENQFNRATSAMRQPGSVFKPIVYAAAINSAYDLSSRVFTAATTFKDEKKIFTYGRETYSPNNYGDVFTNKEITLRDALVKSKNVITVELAMELNIGKIMNLAHKFGLPKVEKAYPSMALGTAEATPLQVATAYTVFANLGEKVMPEPISLITTGDGRTLVKPNVEKFSVLHPDVVYIVNDMLKDVINRGTGAAAQNWGFRNTQGRAFAGKTGTSKDAWFAGFTPNLVCVVYVGFDDGSDLGLKGSDAALPIWADFMKTALELHPEWNGDWTIPDTIVKAEIDIRNGKVIREIGKSEEQQVESSVSNLPSEEVPAEFRRIELFIIGTVPNQIFQIEEESFEPEPVKTSTPFKTWTEEIEANSSASISEETEKIKPNIQVTVCKSTGLRATSSCPDKKLETFTKGEEPKDSCFIHSPKP